ncbi:hypothetical protein SAY87_006640 [Trapa incisa]|uniref:Uncharacterized protein n=1 Tax=Trapa incisa TaxID=236973 RepID=A0AAN7PZI8_9MYRT|nr:hypothetical protein SAY87_006640 [Trapa incisa]
MSNSGGFAVNRIPPDSRFYHPPHVRRQQQQQKHQQQQQPQQAEEDVRSETARVGSVDPEPVRTDSDDSALSHSRPNSVCSASTIRSVDLTNLDRFVESVIPSVRTHQFREEKRGEGRRPEHDSQPYFLLKDLREAFKKWSVYGVGVPLVLNGCESVKQYYVPSLSGIQLYLDTNRMRKPGEDSDAESLRESSSSVSSEIEAESMGKSNTDGIKSQVSVNLNTQKMNRLSLKDSKPLRSSSGDEADDGNSSGQLVFEYLEREQPHHRMPLSDKVQSLCSMFPDLKTYKSCDLSPASWISVAWYPIYRIPVGPTLQNLDTSFLTFHCLSTRARGKVEPQHAPGGSKVYGSNSPPRLPLPVFGLASYKLRSSIMSLNSTHEWQQASSLLQAAEEWLRKLEVSLPDYQFFISHNSNWR